MCPKMEFVGEQNIQTYSLSDIYKLWDVENWLSFRQMCSVCGDVMFLLSRGIY